jgi:hypothetical protein
LAYLIVMDNCDHGNTLALLLGANRLIQPSTAPRKTVAAA